MRLQIKNISKTYSSGVQALKNISLDIDSGMFGLLGPNGAGKTTLMRTIATLQEPDEGTIHFDGVNVLTEKDEIRKILGYLPQEFGVYPKINTETMLDHLAVLKGITNAKERKEIVKALLHKTNLFNDRKKKLGGFSGGMKQRFGIAQALLSKPKLIIVDEPTAGLDPTERNRFLNLLSEIGENTVVILSTHIVEDVKELCTDMAIINNGELILRTKPIDAIEKLNGRVWKKRILKNELDEYRKNFKIISEKLIGGNPEIHILNGEKPESGFIPIEASLEDVYFTELLNN